MQEEISVLLYFSKQQFLNVSVFYTVRSIFKSKLFLALLDSFVYPAAALLVVFMEESQLVFFLVYYAHMIF